MCRYSKLSNSSTNHSVTPTYQSLLILALDTVAQRLMDEDYWGGWQALKTLFAELPPECQKDCREEMDSTEFQLERIYAWHGYTVAETYFGRAGRIKPLLCVENLRLFDKIKASLFEKGYLEYLPTKPRNPQPTTLGEST
jgi:hypothetical protein